MIKVIVNKDFTPNSLDENIIAAYNLDENIIYDAYNLDENIIYETYNEYTNNVKYYNIYLGERFIGTFLKKRFITLAEFREQRINKILDV